MKYIIKCKTKCIHQLPRRVKDGHTPVHLQCSSCMIWIGSTMHWWDISTLIWSTRWIYQHKMDTQCAVLTCHSMCLNSNPIYMVQYIRYTRYDGHGRNISDALQSSCWIFIGCTIRGGAASACNGANTSLKGRKIMLMLETQWHQLDQSSNFIEKLLIFEVLSSLWQMTSATLVPPLVSKKPWCIGIYSSTALLAKFKPDKSTQVQMGQVQTTNFSLDLGKR